MTTYYLDFGDVYGPRGEGTTPIGNAEVDPADISTVKALWAALPPDLRLALAKTAPRVAGPWESWGRLWRRRCPSTLNDLVSGEEHQRPELDSLLLADGYVLDGDTP